MSKFQRLLWSLPALENQIDSLERTVAWFDRHLKGLNN